MQGPGPGRKDRRAAFPASSTAGDAAGGAPPVVRGISQKPRPHRRGAASPLADYPLRGSRLAGAACNSRNRWATGRGGLSARVKGTKQLLLEQPTPSSRHPGGSRDPVLTRCAAPAVHPPNPHGILGPDLRRGDGRVWARGGQVLAPPRLRGVAPLPRRPRGYPPYATVFCCCSPRPSMPSRMVWPGLSQTGSGLMPMPTPGGVPVEMMSPGCRLMNWLT